MEPAVALSKSVPSSVRDRGQEYFRSGAVELDYVNSREAGATVEGQHIYEVDLTLEGGTVYAQCTCPYADGGDGQVCKHIWATVLAAQKRGFAKSVAHQKLKLILEDERDDFEDEDEDEYEEPYQSAYVRKYTPAPKPKAPRETWKDHLAALNKALLPAATAPDSYSRGGAPASAPEQRLLYVVNVETSAQDQQLFLELQYQERKKNQEWGKPKAFPGYGLKPESVANDCDRHVFALLKGASSTNGYGYSSYSSYGERSYCLSGPLLVSVLSSLAATGRVRLRFANQPLEPLTDVVADLDPPWKLTVSVARDSKHWTVGGRLVRTIATPAGTGEAPAAENGAPVQAAPSDIPIDTQSLSPGKREVSSMELTKPTLIIPGLVVWDNRLTRLDDSGAFAWVPVLRRVGKIKVPIARADELLQQLLAMPRIPTLELPDELRFTEETVAPRPKLTVKAPKPQSGGTPMISAHLNFDYAGRNVNPADPTRGILLTEEKRFLLRDRDAERLASQKLAQLGVKPVWSSDGQRLEFKAAQLPKLVRELMGAGWQVEAEGKLYRQAGEFRLDVKSQSDWFDLNATIDFEGSSVSLPRLLAAIHRGESSIVLDDGSLGMVPEDWLKKYGLVARMGKIEGDAIRFSQSQVGVLDALLASRPEVSVDETFARARDRLKQFEGVAPADPPVEFQGELRGYQKEGLGWLHFLRVFGFGGCLADDMGLGKTVQILALLAATRKGTSLVVVPRSLIFNWKQEAARFAPDLKVLDHTGQFRDRTTASFKDHDLVLTTYGTLRNDAAAFSEFRFNTCVLDESQAAKNIETETAKAVRLINADHRLALSGTPVENHLGELWTLFDFLNPGMLGRGMFVGAAGNYRNPDPETRELLAKALRPFILRRTKDQVAKDLPEKTEQTVYCDLEGEQRELYDELRDHYRLALLSKVDSIGLKKSKFQILEALLRLRQAACHPGLIDKKRTGQSSAKLEVLLPQLTEIAESGHKTLVFSQFTSLLSIVRSRLDAEKVPYEYLDGRTRDRAARVERFQTDPDCRLFLISLKAGGVGLNLTAAEYVFLLDPWWNPAVEAQAIDRSHRIGQTKPVFAYRLIARNTVEEKVLALQAQKRELADAILGGDGRLITDLKREDLELLLS